MLGPRDVRLAEQLVRFGGCYPRFFCRALGAAMLLPHSLVTAAEREKLLVGASLGDRAVMQHDDLICVGYSRQPMPARAINRQQK